MELSINSKFKPGDTALRFNPSTNKLEEYCVKSLFIQVFEEYTAIGYNSTGDFSYMSEKDLFASKEEFINQL